MESVAHCPRCNCPERAAALTALDHTVSQEPFTISACMQCGLHFTDPRPEPDAIGAYYLSDKYISHTNGANGLADRIYRQVRQFTLRNKHRMIARLRPGGAVLDIGCGTGDFLAYMAHKGYTTQGVEVSDSARQQAQAKRLSVAASMAELPKASAYQVITLWHVLEHVADPLETLKELHLRSATGGLLVIAVPDRDSWDQRHYGAFWAAWDVPRHLFHFTRNDVHELLEKAGFVPVATRPMWFDAPYVSMLSEQYRGAGKLTSLMKGGFWGMCSNLAALVSNRPTSSSLYIAEKRSG
jgi:SAM-dependent methyltransferase